MGFIERKARCVWLVLVVASCGGKSATEISSGSGGASVSAAGGASTVGGASGNGSTVAGSGNGVAGGSLADEGGSSPIGAMAGSASTLAGESGAPDAEAGMSCEDIGRGCLSKPTDADCNSDADCMIGQVPSCGDTPLIGLNKQGKLTCIAPACVPPPPGATFYYAAQDCSQLVLATQARVHCVNQICLTYDACNECLR
jgi:hypothetical protein